jgi:hypothetical protein
MEEHPLSVFESVKVASLRPGDVVLFRCRRLLSAIERERATDVLNSIFPDNEVLILDDGQDVAVLRPESRFWVKRFFKRFF